MRVRSAWAFTMACLLAHHCTVLYKSNANELWWISWLFLAFRRDFPSNEISVTFPQTFKAPIVLFLGNFRTIIHGGRWQVRKFWAKVRSFQPLTVKFQKKIRPGYYVFWYKLNEMRLQFVICCCVKETKRTSEITFINSINYYIVLTCWTFDC